MLVAGTAFAALGYIAPGRDGRPVRRGPGQRLLALAAGDRPGRAGLPAAAPQRGPAGQPDGVRVARPAVRGAGGLQPAARGGTLPGTLLPAVAEAAARSVSASGRDRHARRARQRARLRHLGHGRGSPGPRRPGAQRGPRPGPHRRRACPGPPAARTRTCGCSRPSPTRPPSRSATPRSQASWPTTSPSWTGPRRSSPSPGSGSSRPTTPHGGPSRRPSPARCCPTWRRFPARSARPARRSRRRSPEPGSTGWSTARTRRWSRCASSPGASSRPSWRGPASSRRCGRCSTRSGLEATLTVDGAANARFSPRVEAALYFCCVEAARVGAGRFEVALSLAGDDLVLRIDGVDGAGVDLQSITDRVEAAGGSLASSEHTMVLTVGLGSRS